jgi:hypothetical protein
VDQVNAIETLSPNVEQLGAALVLETDLTARARLWRRLRDELQLGESKTAPHTNEASNNA